MDNNSTEDEAPEPHDETVNDESYRSSRAPSISDSAVEICVVEDRDRTVDSGVAADGGDALQVLEQKIDRLHDMFQEQCRLLSTLKEELRSSQASVDRAEAEQDVLVELLAKRMIQTDGIKSEEADGSQSEPESNRRAQSLLDALEVRRGVSVDDEITDALKSFLQSDELKEHMVAATAQSVKEVIGDTLSRDVPQLYLSMLGHSHRRLLRQLTGAIEEAFVELEENSACLSKSVYKVTRSLQRSLERHRQLLAAAADPRHHLLTTLKCTVEELLQKEMQQWRQKIVDLVSQPPPAQALLPYTPASPGTPFTPTSPGTAYTPTGPPAAPAEPSLIDQLMTSAEITKRLEEGDVNGAFTVALSAGSLPLVVETCRRAAAFAPRCRLAPPALLALLQQLSTDLLHHTDLKCRYMEDAIIHLDPASPLIRPHLPLVVGEIRKHLTKFRSQYPGHAANNRIALIMMAADNLLK